MREDCLCSNHQQGRSVVFLALESDHVPFGFAAEDTFYALD